MTNHLNLVTAIKATKGGDILRGEYYIDKFLNKCSDYRYEVKFYDNRFTGGDRDEVTGIRLVSPAFFQNVIDSAGFFKSALFPNRERPFIVETDEPSKRTDTELLEIENLLQDKTFNNFDNLFGDVLDRLIIDYLAYGYVGMKMEVDDQKNFKFTALPADEIFFYLGDKSFPVLFVHSEKVTDVEVMERYGVSITPKEDTSSVNMVAHLNHLYIHKSSNFFTGNGDDKTEYEYHLYDESSSLKGADGKPIVIYYSYSPIYIANLFSNSKKDYGNGDGVRSLPYVFLLNKYLLKLDQNSDLQIQPPWVFNNLMELENTILKLRPRSVSYIRTPAGQGTDIKSLAGLHDPTPTIKQAQDFEERIKEIFSISDYEKIISSKGQRVVLEVDTALRASIIKFSTKSQGVRSLLRGAFKTCLDILVKDSADIKIEINSKEKEMSINASKQDLVEATQYVMQISPFSLKNSEAVSENMRLYGLSHLLETEEDAEQKAMMAQQQQQEQEAIG